MHQEPPKIEIKSTQEEVSIDNLIEQIPKLDTEEVVAVADSILENRILLNENIRLVIDCMKSREDYRIKKRMGQICVQNSILSDAPSEEVVNGLSYLVSENTEDMRTEQLDRYQRKNYKIQYESPEDIVDSLKEILGNPDIYFVESEDHRYRLLDQITDDLVAEFSLQTNREYYLENVHYVKEGDNRVSVCIHDINSNQQFPAEQLELIKIGIDGLIKCSRKGCKLGQDTLSSIEMLAQNDFRTKLRDISIALISRYVKNNPNYFYENEDTMLQIFIHNDYHDKNSLRRLSHIIRSVEPHRLDNKDIISEYLKNNICTLIGGDKKMCRRAIAKLTNTSPIKLYINELIDPVKS